MDKDHHHRNLSLPLLHIYFFHPTCLSEIHKIHVILWHSSRVTGIDADASFGKNINNATADLDKKVIARYKTLSTDEIKSLVVDDKWMTTIEKDVRIEVKRISQILTQRIKELAERYEMLLPSLQSHVKLSIHWNLKSLAAQ